jgi:hypothetical protein
MGANITPMMKNSGRTVFGVKMGLSQIVSHGPARPTLAFHVLPCFQSLLSERRIYTPSVPPACARHCPAVPLTRWPPALRLLVVFAGRVLAGYRVRMLDLLCLRHGDCFCATPRVCWWRKSAAVVTR